MKNIKKIMAFTALALILPLSMLFVGCTNNACECKDITSCTCTSTTPCDCEEIVYKTQEQMFDILTTVAKTYHNTGTRAYSVTKTGKTDEHLKIEDVNMAITYDNANKLMAGKITYSETIDSTTTTSETFNLKLYKDGETLKYYNTVAGIHREASTDDVKGALNAIWLINVSLSEGNSFDNVIDYLIDYSDYTDSDDVSINFIQMGSNYQFTLTNNSTSTGGASIMYVNFNDTSITSIETYVGGNLNFSNVLSVTDGFNQTLFDSIQTN